mmetsp:Transcript_18040/g.43364  ORF Transcript_18040/g.43364 Transcript_18040/m.43364 type:complete len:114 (+) Transcript_18040:378-719(+)
MLNDISHMNQIKRLLSTCPVLEFGKGTIGRISKEKPFIRVMSKTLPVDLNYTNTNIETNVNRESISHKAIKNPVDIATWDIDHRFDIEFDNGIFDNFEGSDRGMSTITALSRC